MRTNVHTILVATCLFAGSAAAKRLPEPPDFQQGALDHRANRSQPVSDATSLLAPTDLIPFDFDSSTLAPVDRIQIRQAARWLKDHPGYRIVVEGHTDAFGGEAYNVGLAARRARAVRDELLRYGIRPDRVVAAIYGESKPQSRNRFSPANRVVLLYATEMTPAQIVKRTLPIGSAVLWS